MSSKGAASNGPEKTRERAPTEELLELPRTTENLHAKVDALIVTVEINNDLTKRALNAFEEGLEEIRQARQAATNAANHALKRTSLLPTERMGALFAGAFTGSALVTLAMWLTGIGAAGVAIASCK
jgi:hypothetical protein